MGVGAPDAVHSSVWRFWAHGDDVYVAAREGVRFAKFSLHKSGKWRFAFVAESQVSMVGAGNDRVVARWTRPAEFRKGWTQCLDVNVPAFEVRRRFSAESLRENGTIDWLPPPQHDHGWQLTVLQSAPGASSYAATHGLNLPGDRVFAPLPLMSGGSVWMVARDYAMDRSERAYMQSRDVRISATSPNPSARFAAVIEYGGDLHPVVTNYALGWDRVTSTKSLWFSDLALRRPPWTRGSRKRATGTAGSHGPIDRRARSKSLPGGRGLRSQSTC